MSIVQLEFDLFQKTDMEKLQDRMDALEQSHHAVRRGMFKRLGDLNKLQLEFNKIHEEIRLALELLGDKQ